MALDNLDDRRAGYPGSSLGGGGGSGVSDPTHAAVARLQRKIPGRVPAEDRWVWDDELADNDRAIIVEAIEHAVLAAKRARRIAVARPRR